MKLEDYIFDKIYELFNKLLSLKIKPDIEINEVLDLTEELIDEIKFKYNVKGIVLDVDETLRYNGKPINDEVLSWIDMLQDKLKVIVISNGYDEKVKAELEKRNIVYIPLAFKPLKKKTQEAIPVHLGIGTSETLMVGDNVLDDIYLGNKLHMTTVKVRGKKLKN